MPVSENFVHKGYELTEAQLRYAMANTSSNSEAAKWLHISFTTWKKYALSYIDSASGLTLYELHKKVGLKNRKVLPKAQKEKRKVKPWYFVPIPIADILAGLHPNYNIFRLKERMISEHVVADRCNKCGFGERRKFDYQVPLRLNFLDGNMKNLRKENLELLCYNCYYIHVGNLHGVNKKAQIDEDTGEIVPSNKKYRRG